MRRLQPWRPPPPPSLGARLLIKEGYFVSVRVTFCPPNENNLREHEVDITLYMVAKIYRMCQYMFL